MSRIRRSLTLTCIALGAIAVGASASIRAQSSPAPVPREAHADLPGVHLWYRDTGGRGTPVVLLHAATGSSRAWEYQIPVFILTDMNQSNAIRAIDVDHFDMDAVIIDRGELLTDADLDGLTEPYLRHKLTDSGISPRAMPGHPNGVMLTTSDEHYENGQAVEEPEMRILQMDKRMRKLDLAANDIKPPLLEGPEDAELTLVGWGTTYGPIHEARLLLAAEGLRVNHLHYSEVWPFPAARTEEVLRNARRVIAVENNYTGQLALVIRMMTGIDIPHKILKYDGRPFSGDDLARKVREGVLANV